MTLFDGFLINLLLLRYYLLEYTSGFCLEMKSFLTYNNHKRHSKNHRGTRKAKGLTPNCLYVSMPARQIFQLIKTKYRETSILKKIAILFTFISCISVLLSITISQLIFGGMLRDKTLTIAKENLQTVIDSTENYIRNIDRLSYIVLYNKDVQQILKEKDESDYALEVSSNRSVINQLMEGVRLQTNDIDSLYIFDNNNHKYYSLQNSGTFPVPKSISDEEWYQQVCDAKGKAILRLTSRSTGQSIVNHNNLSLIRVINDIQTREKIGISIVNILADRLEKHLQSILESRSIDISMWLDENDAPNKLGDFTITAQQLERAANAGIMVHGQDGREAMLTTGQSGQYGLTFACITPMSKDGNLLLIYSFIIIINIIIMLLGSLFISNMIVRPINQLLSLMGEVGKNHFAKAEWTSGNDEIGLLRNGYNNMISEIQYLIQNIVEEQKLRRKYELNVMLEQVKPHFLYNSFDVIGSLAIKNEDIEVYNLLAALGEFYKKSLNNGSEMLPLKDELAIVKDYLKIQQYRFKDLFQVVYQIDDCQIMVPKLILQPLVENAINHGIRKKGEPGTIEIAVVNADDYIELSVADDGVGMTEEQAYRILHDKGIRQQSFGIPGIIERLQLIYRKDDLLSIETNREEGIRVIIMLPKTSPDLTVIHE